MEPIHQAIAWLTLAQQIEFAGEQLWADLKAVFARYEIDIDTESLDAIIHAAQRRRDLWRATHGLQDNGE